MLILVWGGALKREDFVSIRDELFAVTPLESLDAMDSMMPEMPDGLDDTLDESVYWIWIHWIHWIHLIYGVQVLKSALCRLRSHCNAMFGCTVGAEQSLAAIHSTKTVPSMKCWFSIHMQVACSLCCFGEFFTAAHWKSHWACRIEGTYSKSLNLNGFARYPSPQSTFRLIRRVFFFSLYFGRRDHEGTLRNALDTRQISDTQSI